MKKTSILKFAILSIGIFSLGDVVYAATGSNTLGKENTYKVEAGTNIDTLYKEIKEDRNGVSDVNIKEGNIDTKKIGTYHITVSAKNFVGIESSKNATVKVVDTTKPVISGKTDFETKVGQDVDFDKELKVTDNADKEVKLKVSHYDKEKVGIYNVVASAEDSSGNKSEKKLSVKVVDGTQPTIEAPDTTVEKVQAFSNM